MPRLIITSLLSLMLVESRGAIAQPDEGKWSVGLRGGINILVNDFNIRKVGPGLEASARYGLSPMFSVGATAGYEELKSHQVPYILPLPYDYIKLNGFPLSVAAWFYPMPGENISPYVHAGVGALFYTRYDGAKFVPDDGLNSSIHIPLGVGVEAFPMKNLSVDLDLSFGVLDDGTEIYSQGGPDTYPGLKVGVNLYFGESEADDDDTDGLSNGEEEKRGTNPTIADSDGDGLTDGDEVQRFGSDPLQADTDGDGITDGDEVLTTKTDPMRTDSDGDGVGDNEERKNGTSPFNPDTDGDGLSDGEEVGLGSNPIAMDSDSDGLVDRDEVKTYATKVLQADTDGDGLSDGDEVLKMKTDPLNDDTDGGGVSDGNEVERNSNPLDPLDDLLKEKFTLEPGKPLVLEGIVFAPGKARIEKGSERTLEDAFIALVLRSDIAVDIVGHTDNLGSAEANDKLSLDRARAVKTWLVEHGIPEDRLGAIGKGMREPIAPNDTPAGREKNRRIEFRVRQQ